MTPVANSPASIMVRVVSMARAAHSRALPASLAASRLLPRSSAAWEAAENIHHESRYVLPNYLLTKT